MSGPTTFKVTERLGPLGTLAKLPIDYREATLDFTRWLASGEIVTSVAQHGIQVDPEPTCNGSWSIAFDCSGCCTSTTARPDPLPQPAGTAYSVDGSTVLITGGVAQFLFGGSTPLSGYEISNPHPTQDLWVTDQGTASIGGVGCFRVSYQGGTYTTPLGYAPLGPVSIIGAVTGQNITARAWGGVTAPLAAPADPDINPLEVLVASVTHAGTKATLLIGQGTPGLTYAVSFLAIVSPSQRRKAVDLLVCVGTPMVDIELPTLPPPPAYQFVTDSIDLAFGSTGSIFVNNISNSAITITLPPNPVINQNLVIKDIVGNSGTYPITVDAVGYTIDGEPNLVIRFNFGWAEFTFTGVQWVQIS